MKKFISPGTANFNAFKLGIVFSIIIGAFSYFISVFLESDLVDPLLLAMVLGILCRSYWLKSWKKSDVSLSRAAHYFITFGIAFYALKNLNFVKYARNYSGGEPFLIVLVILTYFLFTLWLGRILKQKDKITYLVATGSAICGASAITLTASATDPEPDDVSISLIAVAAAGTVALFIILPFLATFFELNNQTYSMFSGSILQFTGFVKAAMGDSMPPLKEEILAKAAYDKATSIKAMRYLGLLLALPLFGSLAKKKFYFPLSLIIFLGAGCVGSLICYWFPEFYKQSLLPFIKPIFNIAWSIALGAIGLNADFRMVFNNDGVKALVMALGGFLAAVAVFFIFMFFK